MKWVFRLGLVLSLIIILGIGCAKKEQGTIKIGIIAPLTGSQSHSGDLQKRGYEIALEEINLKGGVLGKRLELVYEDDQGKPEIAMSAMEKLAQNDKLVAVIGSYSSSCTLPISQLATKYGIPLVSPCAAEEKITTQGNQWVFRINAPSNVYARTMIDFALSTDEFQTCAILHESTTWGSGVGKIAEEYAKSKGLEVVYFDSYKREEMDFHPYLTKTKEKSPDLLLMFSYEVDAISLMRQSHELNVNPKMYLGGGAGFAVPGFISDLKKDAEYVYSVAQWTPDVGWPGASEFNEKYRKIHNVDSEYHPAETYVALLIAVDAIKRAGQVERRAVRDALGLTDTMSILGPMKFENYEDYTNQNKHPMLIIQVQNGKFVTVYPKEWAAASPMYPTPTWGERE